ncbi:hypothetical protein CHS0354_039428 [Potamilus streckersoni]|uniref:LRAT domain-containing protein n=1 Tax=Potamilus streckersoni TaxID=2493646 RepID=A0AAE0VN00_9BIVA|nr:hypothetical protein CHS0354_039428 [Potamilus streckersoni]
MSARAIRRQNEAVLRDLEKGDMIQFPRGLYSHWAVYIGNDEVVHLAGDLNATSKENSNSSYIFSISGVNFDKASVKIDNFFEVAGNSKARKNNDKDQHAEPSDKETIVERALSKRGEIGYNVLWNNCEYFASWCRYGNGWSEQTIKFLITAGLVVCVAKRIISSAFGTEKRFDDPENVGQLYERPTFEDEDLHQKLSHYH